MLYDIKRLEIELTNNCEHNCKLCYRNFMGIKNNNTELSIDKIKETLKGFPNIETITLAGWCNPTNHSQFLDIVKFLAPLYYLEICLPVANEDDTFYKKLAVILMKYMHTSKITINIFGSNNNINSIARTTNIDRIFDVYNIINRYYKSIYFLWHIYDFNFDDYKQNRELISSKFRYIAHPGIPFKEFYDDFKEFENIESMPDNRFKLPKHYNLNIDENHSDIDCISQKNNFAILSCDGKLHLCTLNRFFGSSKCYNCSKNNQRMFEKEGVYPLCDSSDDTSEIYARIEKIF